MSTAPTTAEADKIDIQMGRMPVAEIDYSQYPEKTRREMMAGKEALNKSKEMRSHVGDIMTMTANEMFSKQAKERLHAKHQVNLSPGTIWNAEAKLDVGKQEWSVTLTVRRPDAPVTELTEPFVQFPSDEMITWLILVG